MKNNNKNFEYAYTPQFIEPKYKFVSDWVYKKMFDGLKEMHAGKIRMVKGKEVREFYKMKYFVAAYDLNGFVCWEMEDSPEKDECTENRFAHVYARTMPDIGLPEYVIDADGYEDDENPEIQEVRLQAMRTAIVQLHKEGQFEGLIESYPCEIRLGLCNEIYNEGMYSKSFLTITGKDGETPLPEDLPAIVPDELLCTDYCNDEMYNLVFGYELKYNKKLVLDGNSLKKYSLSKLHLPSGKIVAADPMANGHKEHFIQTVAPGEYEANIYLDKNDRVALAAVFFPHDDDSSWQSNEAIRWEPAHTCNEENSYTVSSGFGSFMDAETLADIYKLGQLPVGINETINHVSCTVAEGKNALLFRSGIGEGVYHSYFGYDTKNRINCLITDFHIIDRPQEDIPKASDIYDATMEFDNTGQKPFLYFGAGAVSDYYKLDIAIKFVIPPTEQQQQQISNNAPELLHVDSFCDVDILNIDGCDNRNIENYYGFAENHNEKEENEYDDDFEDEDSEEENEIGYLDNEDSEEDDEIVQDNSLSEQAMRAFENNINKWLHEVHAICPIQFVIRGRYDKPHEGVTPSHWHYESMKQLPALLQQLSSYRCTELRQRNIISHLLCIMFCYAERENIDFDVELIRHASPRCYADFLMRKGNYNQLKESIETENIPTALFSLTEGVGDYLRDKKFDDYNKAEFYEIQNLIVDTIINKLNVVTNEQIEPWGERWLIGTVNDLCYLHIVPQTIVMAILKNDNAALQKITDLYKTIDSHYRWNILKGMNVLLVDDMIKNKHWQLALQGYEYTLGLISGLGYDKFTEVSIYCNALYVCTTGNTGLAVDIDLNNRILALCMPHADENCTVYYNAACVYVEMKDYIKALDCMKKYFKKSTENDWYEEERKRMMDELKTDKAFDEFRKQKDTAEFISKLK